ncbi:hypothetical protein RB25_03280 [Herbaspirillum rubrisubalbicans]|jgi:hypothetical protein|uniref:Transmembrane protein n=1 Tax=Herbaspirillum rubrisubalbicans TaxID=80842 RepID=A0ABX9C356_9BURK|nr:hypothetical protein [Herbaspirillum rubrisubalbicans]NQE48140.1 hypothetical protein [Herbaspirillum rubrisubalbicans]RAM64665.1 hypothetical protein RB24_10740 [Herbaspirillum rubrisubalbicans]RAN49887.1 hypothetical protein RB25_03280 [Herbaspirillum rubrisubalbicans]
MCHHQLQKARFEFLERGFVERRKLFKPFHVQRRLAIVMRQVMPCLVFSSLLASGLILTILFLLLPLLFGIASRPPAAP